MDGTERIETGVAEAEFSRQYEEISKERDIPSIISACRKKAIFSTIEKFSKHLDRVLVQKLKDGRIDLTYKIFPDLFVDPKNEFFWAPAATNNSVMVVHPIPRIDAQGLQNILRELSVKAKAGSEGKIILPDGYFYFTWFGDDMYEIEGDAYNNDRVIQAADFTSAVVLMKQRLYSLTAEIFRVYYGGKWRGIKLVTNHMILDRWDRREDDNIKFIEKK